MKLQYNGRAESSEDLIALITVEQRERERERERESLERGKERSSGER